MCRFIVLQLTRVISVAALLALSVPAFAQDWATTPIVGGYAIDIPTNWKTKSQAYKEALDRTTRSKMQFLPQWRSKLVYAAQLLDQKGVQIGWVSVRTHPEYEKIQAVWNQLTPRHYQLIYDQILAKVELNYSKLGLKVIERIKPRTLKIGKYDSLLFEYRRKNPWGSTSLVRTLMVLNGKKSLGVTVSDDERFPKLRPVTDHILTSIRDRAE